MRLMLVDDEPRILSGLSRALRSSGSRDWEVATATSGEEALARLLEHPADVVVSDVNMPGMDGPTLLAEVRNRWPDVVRLVLSGYADLCASQKLAAIAHQFFDKPLRIADLVDSLRRIERLRTRFADPALRALLGGVGALPAAPAIFVELSVIIEDPTATIDDVTKVIRRDPAVAAKVLHLASSAFYARGGPIADMRGAVGRLGGRVVRMVALSAAAFRPSPRVAPMLDRLQAHGLQAATLAEAVVGDPAQREAAFVSGLLADLGMVALLTWFPDRYLPLMTATDPLPIHVRERDAFGVSHSEVGAYLLGLWGLPRNVVEAVSCHHEPTAIGEPARDPTLAAYVAHALTSGEPVDELYLARAHCADRLAGWRTLVTEVSSSVP